MTDAELVRRVLDGDRTAFTELADRHSPACLRFATRMLGSVQDAEDVTQDALVRAYRALAVYDDRSAFRTWLFAILVNRCRSALTARTRRERRVRSDPEQMDRATVEADDRRTELRVELTRAMDRLSEEHREAFLLKHVEQLEYTEMAAVTGVQVSALKMRVQRACRQLRQELQEYES